MPLNEEHALEMNPRRAVVWRFYLRVTSQPPTSFGRPNNCRVLLCASPNLTPLALALRRLVLGRPPHVSSWLVDMTDNVAPLVLNGQEMRGQPQTHLALTVTDPF